LVATGVPFALFNPAFSPLLCGGAAGDGGAFLATARAFYQHEGLPWALVLDEHEAAAPAAPRQILLAGLRPVEPLPVFVHATVPGAHWPPPASWLDVRVVRTPNETADHRALLQAAFGISEEMSAIVLATVPASPLLVLYVAYDRTTGQAVGSAALCEGGGLAGVYNVATHPDFRRKGVAATLMRAVLDDACARGLRTSVLQSSLVGRALYARLGFRHLKTYAVFVCDGTRS
jgi:ribosomal protein S18 acetylase RimI-like enzyme